jgi:hypothetical protein
LKVDTRTRFFLEFESAKAPFGHPISLTFFKNRDLFPLWTSRLLFSEVWGM